MSSIMDELRRLQGGRTPTQAPPPVSIAPAPPARPGRDPAPMPGTPLSPHPSSPAHVLTHSRRRPKHLIGVLAFAFVGLLAVMALPTLGGRSSTPTRKALSTPEGVLARAENQPIAASNAPPSVEVARGTPPEPEGPPADPPREVNANASAEGSAPATAYDPIETLLEPSFVLAAVTGPSRSAEADLEPSQTDPAETEASVAEAVVPPSSGTLDGPRSDLASVRAGGNNEPDSSAATPAKEADPEERADATLEDSVAKPARVLSEAEDKANKAAIQALSVRAVFGDEEGIVVYTSAGRLREGGRFKGMDIIEVSVRSVLFECGNKRYRWCLPRHGTAAAGPGAS